VIGRTEKTLRSVLKETIWVAIGWYSIIGPYFFEDKHGHPVTANQENYGAMIIYRFLTFIILNLPPHVS